MKEENKNITINQVWNLSRQLARRLKELTAADLKKILDELQAKAPDADLNQLRIHHLLICTAAVETILQGTEELAGYPHPRKPSVVDREFLQLAAATLEAKLPDNWKFILLAAPVGNAPDRRLVYTSSMKREDAIPVLKEWFLHIGHAENWMQHTK